jgi:UDP-N-acetylmuramoyl-L-alanyl-D-glutamate--2,6-diaminopimelate ligase
MNMADAPWYARNPDSVIENLHDLIAVVDNIVEQAPAGIRGATASSREVKAGMAFLAYPGASRDGREFIGDAIARGASFVLHESDNAGEFVWDASWRVPRVAVRGLKQFASAIGGHFYQHPSNALWMVGVTGTNGKTSVSQWVARALEKRGRPAAVLGTIGNGLVRDTLHEADNTTPDALALQRMLREFSDAGATSCAMEVSSHGLDQRRVADVKFDVAVFTNLTRDHLDYHGTMEAYGAAKAKLFAQRDLKAAVVNVDDMFGREIAKRVEVERPAVDVIRYAMNGGSKFANLIATDISISSAGLSFVARGQNGLVGEARVESTILGAFNVGNLLAVIGVLLASGVSFADAAKVVSELASVPGRMQTVREANRPLVVVDYAHTPDALEKALATISAIVPEKGKLISIFGCGGDRDRGKRPLMGAISAKYADVSVVTSDNPRTEAPDQIIADIVEGMRGANHRVVADRQQAIFEALNLASIDDVVLIAGKGHEDYQIVGTTKHHFSDVDVAREALRMWRGHANSQGNAR